MKNVRFFVFRMDRQTDGEINLGNLLRSSTGTLTARGLAELFFWLCGCVSFLVVARNGVWFYFITYTHSVAKKTGTILGTICHTSNRSSNCAKKYS
jgi:hypothetical protein